LFTSRLLKKASDDVRREFLDYVKENTPRLRPMLTRPYGEKDIENILLSEGPAPALGDLLAPLVIQRLQKTLTDAQLQQGVDRILKSGPAKQLQQKQQAGFKKAEFEDTEHFNLDLLSVGVPDPNVPSVTRRCDITGEMNYIEDEDGNMVPYSFQVILDLSPILGNLYKRPFQVILLDSIEDDMAAPLGRARAILRELGREVWASMTADKFKERFRYSHNIDYLDDKAFHSDDQFLTFTKFLLWLDRR